LHFVAAATGGAPFAITFAVACASSRSRSSLVPVLAHRKFVGSVAVLVASSIVDASFVIAVAIAVSVQNIEHFLRCSALLQFFYLMYPLPH
jgi:hypothetical protein